MIELIFAPFIIPFALFASLGFWVYAVVAGLFLLSLGMVYKDNRRQYRDEYQGEYLGPIVAMVIIFSLVNTTLVGETTGAWDWFWTVVGNTALSMLHYLAYGVALFVPLWMLHTRPHFEALNDELMPFLSKLQDSRYLDQLLTELNLKAFDPVVLQEAARNHDYRSIPNELRSLWEAYRNLDSHGDFDDFRLLILDDVKLNDLLARVNRVEVDAAAIQAAASSHMRGQDIPEVLMVVWRPYRAKLGLEWHIAATNPKKNRMLMASFVILWPFHTVDKLLGEILYRGLRWCVARLADLASLFGRAMKYGMPSNIDE